MTMDISVRLLPVRSPATSVPRVISSMLSRHQSRGAGSHAGDPPRGDRLYFDMDDATLAEFEVFAKKVAKAIRTAFPCKKVAQVVLGLEVPHAHIHLMPINTEGDVDFKKHVKLTEEEMKTTAAKIYDAFKAAE